MNCDYCDTDAGVSQYWNLDLDLCPSCVKRFEYKQKLEWKGLKMLEAQQAYFESCAISYVYSHPST